MMPDGIDFQALPSAGADGIDFQPTAETGLIGQEIPPNPHPSGPLRPDIKGAEFENAAEGEGVKDTTVADEQMLEGIGAIGKLGVGLVAKGAGAALNAIPATENFIPSVERVANNQTLKSLGGTMGQLGQMEKGRGGREALDTAAKYARDKGLTDVFSTGIGREKQLEAMKKASGETIGSLREEAGKAPADIESKVLDNPEISKYLGKGSYSKELPAVDTALEDIKEVGGAEPTHKSLADAATFINKNAAGAKMYQPVNAATDVANALSKENNSGIVQTLGADKGKQYLDALEEQTRLHPLEHLQQRGELREAGGRGGLGTRVIQEIADRMGYRLTAKSAAKMADMLKGEGLEKTASKVGSKLTKPLVPAAIAEYVNGRTNKGAYPR